MRLQIDEGLYLLIKRSFGELELMVDAEVVMKERRRKIKDLKLEIASGTSAAWINVGSSPLTFLELHFIIPLFILPL